MTATSPGPATRSRTDLDELQGAWVAVAGRRAATLSIDGDRYVFEIRPGDQYTGTFVLGTLDHPKRMDMRIADGPRYTGLTAYCIYHVEAGVLRWCPTQPGTPDRLVRFPDLDDPNFLSLVFRQVGPRRGA